MTEHNTETTSPLKDSLNDQAVTASMSPVTEQQNMNCFTNETD